MKLSVNSLFLGIIILLFASAGNGETCGKITSWQKDDIKSLTGIDAEVLDNDGIGLTNYFVRNNDYASDCSPGNKYTWIQAYYIWTAHNWNMYVTLYSYGTDSAARECLGNYLEEATTPQGHVVGVVLEQSDGFALYYNDGYEQEEVLFVEDFRLLSVYQGVLIRIVGSSRDGFYSPVEVIKSYFKLIHENAKALINSKCALSACATGKMTLPSELSYLFYDQYDYSPLDGIVLGTDPALVRPLYIGKPEGGLHFEVGFCEFNEPVDINLVCYIGTSPAHCYYVDSNRKSRYFGHVSTSQISTFLSNLKQPTSVSLGGDFGGLFQGLDNLPKGFNEFYLGVVPSGGSFSDLKLIYHTRGTGECAGQIPVPTGKQIWFHAPVPVPVFGLKPYDPSKLRPLAVGPIALGENQVAMYMDICPFDLKVDTHFAVYCPEEDAVNVYFLTRSKVLDQSAQGSATPDEFEELLWEKVPLSNVLDGFPQECWDKEYVSDRYQYGDSWLLIPDPLGGMPASVTQRLTYYMFAVTPDGVRDKFYAWVTTLPINVRHAISEAIRMLEGIQ